MMSELKASADPAAQKPYTYSPAPWLAHDMTPKDPYNYQRHQGRAIRRSNIVGSTEQVLGGAKVAGTSEIGTGMQSSLYKPSFGEPQRSFRRKGYFRNPDLAEPRKPPSELQERTYNFKKVGVVSNPPTMPPGYSEGHTSSFLAGGSSSRDWRSEEKKYMRCPDETWEPVSKAKVLLQEKIKAKDEYVAAIKKDNDIRAEQRKAERVRELSANKKVGLEDRYRRPPGPTGNTRRVDITHQQQKWEEAHTGTSYIGQWIGKQGCGAPLRRPDGSIKTNIQSELETHVHKASLVSPVEAAHLAVDPTRHQRMSEYKNTLESQIKQDAMERQLRRQRSQERITLDDGGLSRFGRAGGGAPVLDDKGKIRTIIDPRARGLEAKSPNVHLAKALRDQAREQKRLREQERQAALSNDVNYTPFDKGIPKKEKYGRKEVTKGYGIEDGVRVVEGASLVNTKTWGTLGGGAPPLDYKDGQPRTLPANIVEEEFKIETEAQKQGKSQFGTQGCGAPIRNPDGSIRVNIGGATEKDKSGVTDFRKDVRFRERTKRLAQEQKQFVLQHQQHKQQRLAAELEADKKAMSINFNNDDYEALVETYGSKRIAKAMGQTEGRRAIDKHDMSGLKKQIEEKERLRKQEKERNVKEAQQHFASAAKWQGTSSRGRMNGTTGELSGKYKVDKILHLKDHQKRIRDSPERRRAYKKELDSEVEAKQQHRRANRERKLKEEAAHARAMEDKFKDNKKQTTEKRPYNPLDYEYKALLQKQSHLV
eukprot:m.396654 g.396654  ORF g.396654 m.396654 type:complete len:763 (-) comp21113_c1_seq4:102-2390(-)